MILIIHYIIEGIYLHLIKIYCDLLIPPPLPHSSHKPQPLGIAVYSQLKRCYNMMHTTHGIYKTQVIPLQFMKLKKYYGIAFSRAKVLNQLSLIVCLLLNNSEEIAFGINSCIYLS